MVRFTVQLLARHLLRTCHPTEDPDTVVDLAHCVKEGVEYNWSLYLLNQFIEDDKATQETSQPFHYSWLLIIIVFVGWKEPRYSQFLTVQTNCRGVRYAHLWATKDPEHENLSNMVFYTYY